MNYLQAVDFVNDLEEFRYKFGLKRIKSFLKHFDNPQDKIKVIHVAGTNGKGSVCACISTILQKAGYKIGLFTSPHLLDIRERIQINRKKIPKKDFTKFVFSYLLYSPPTEVGGYNNGVNLFHKRGIKIPHSTNSFNPLTYFELLTAMAFWYFEKEKVDFAVIEVGLGGRLDATNLVKNPLVSVITNISLEHTQYLGNTISKIAKEKAGIIKNNGVIVTDASGVALRTIEKIAKTNNAKIKKIKKLKNYKISLFGEHQKENANLSAAVCRFLGIPEKYIVNGLKNTVWPARFEIRHLTTNDLRLTVILDCAHNPSGMMVLNNSIKRYFNKKINPAPLRETRINFVFGVLADKNYKKMIKIISAAVKNVFISAPKNERALSVEIVKKEFAKYISYKNIFVFSDIKTAVKSAIKKSKDFCITGSTYTVAEALKTIKN